MWSSYHQDDPNSYLHVGILSLTVALMTVLLGACQPQGQQQQAAVDTTRILATFQDSLPQAFEKAVKAGDFEAQASIYMENALYSHPMMPPVQGRDSIEAVLRRTTPPGATADIQSIDTRILSPDWVSDFGTVTLTFTPEGASQPQKITSTYFALFHRTEEGWKIAREALSSNRPPPDSP